MVRSKFNIPDLKDFLDEKSYQYESLEFIKDDPILIPHSFTKKEDIEISGFITSVISWGNRKSIINSAKKIIEFMDNSPFDFAWVIFSTAEILNPKSVKIVES